MQAGSVATDESMSNILKCVEAYRPTLVIVENVPSLAEEVNQATPSDAEYIVEALEEAWMASEFSIFEA